MRTHTRIAALSLAFGLAAALGWPAQAEAQSRRPAVRRPVATAPVVRVQARRYYRPVYRPFVFVGAFGYPRYWYYDPWVSFYDPWYQYPYQYGPYRPSPYGYRLDNLSSDVRIDVEPVEAEVYVDGYLAGVVDDFDGIFQRLHLRPGEHELVLYLQGYRTVRERLYLNARSTKTIRLDMEPLGPGESSERPPEPVARTERDVTPPPDRPQQRPPAREPREPAPPRTGEAPAARFGTLSLRMQPADAEILIDGERWSTTPGESRIAIQLSPGRHKLEIRKDGYERYTEEVGIREGTTLALNVSLKKTN